MNKAIWLGFFFFVSLTVLLYGSLSLTHIRWSKPMSIKILFNKVEGLKVGDLIRVDGFPVGKVSDIELKEEGVRVRGHLEQPIELHEDYTVFVESLTLIGGNYISIFRGTRSRRTLPTDMMLTGAARPSALEEVGKVLSENKTLIRDMLLSMKTVADEARSLVQSIRTGEGTIAKLINDPKIFEGLMKTVDEFRQLAEKANSGSGSLGKLINDPGLYDEMRGAMTDIRGAAASIRQIVDKISTGQGVLGKMVSDPKLAEDVEKALENIRESSEDLKQIMEKIASGKGSLGKLIQDDEIYEKGKSVLTSTDEVLGRAARSRVTVGGVAESYGDSELGITRLFLRLQPDDTKYFQGGVAFFGLSAAGPTIVFEDQVDENDDQLIAKAEIFAFYKIPWFFDNHLGIRGGLIEGKPGGGLDLDVTIGDWPLTASFDIRDAYGHVEDEDIDENIRGPMTRAYLRAPLWAPGGDAWWKQLLHAFKVRGGMSRLQDDPEYFVGVGGELEDKDLRTLVVLLGLGQ